MSGSKLKMGRGQEILSKCRPGRKRKRTDATIETVLASKPFDIARFAVAQGTLADLVVI